MSLELTCKAILFDLDGTLIDSSAVIERVWRAWAISQGLPVDEVLRASYGLRTLDAVYLLAPDLRVEEEAAKIEANEIRDLEGLVPMPGARKLLSSLDGIPWGIVTSGSYLLATSRLKKVGLPIPRVLVSADEVDHGKPDPQGYWLAAEKLGVSPGGCVAFEDSPTGVGAALTAGMRVILVGSNTPTEPADRIIASIEDYYGLSIRCDAQEIVIRLPRPGRMKKD